MVRMMKREKEIVKDEFPVTTYFLTGEEYQDMIHRYGPPGLQAIRKKLTNQTNQRSDVIKLAEMSEREMNDLIKEVERCEIDER